MNQITDQLWAGAGLNVCFSIPSSDWRHGQNYYLLANLKKDSTHSYEIDNVQCRIIQRHEIKRYQHSGYSEL